MNKAKLSVNIDHVATLRQSRNTRYPDPVDAAVLAQPGGADGITHPWEDRRHIQDRCLHVEADSADSLNVGNGADR